ncbi:MAG: hypothetical protein HDS68_09020 [Bacteroidales bacterium]|nr:hypothetical protein [Bacteroidales bacterium]
MAVCLAGLAGIVLSVPAQTPSVGSIIQVNASKREISKPIVWNATAERTAVTDAVIKLSAEIKDGWHLYGFLMPEDGPKPTDIKFSLPEGVRLAGELNPSIEVSRKFDTMFDSEVEFWGGNEIVFTQNLVIDPGIGEVHVMCDISFMGCNDETCLPYRHLSLEIRIPSVTETENKKISRNKS